MKQTTNYQLNKIELTDKPADITVINPNWDKIDTELKNHETLKAPLASPTFTGEPKVPDLTSSSSDSQAVNKKALNAAIAAIPETDISGKFDHTVEVANPNLNTLLDDKAYACSGTITNAPIACTFCILRAYDTGVSGQGNIVQICHVPQTDNSVRTFSRVCVNGITFGTWKEIGSVTSVNGATGAVTVTSNDILPAGTVQQYAGNTIPTGWLECNGQAVSRTDYPNLFAAIGTTWGAGDGSTTFNVPNATNRSIQQGNNTYLSAGLPNITGNFTVTRSIDTLAWNIGTADGAFEKQDSGSSVGLNNYSVSTSGYRVANFDASRCSGLYGASSTVQQSAIGFKVIIKAH